MTDEEVVRIAREAVADLYAEHGRHRDNPEAIGFIRSGAVDTHKEMIFGLAGARAVAKAIAAQMSGGACEPVAWARMDGERIIGLTSVEHIADDWDRDGLSVAPLTYATPPVEPAVVPGGRAGGETLNNELDPLDYGGIPVDDEPASNPCRLEPVAVAEGLVERPLHERAYQIGKIAIDAAEDYGPIVGSPKYKRRHVGYRIFKALQDDPSITADAATIAAKDAEIERLRAYENGYAEMSIALDQAQNRANAAEARITDLQATVTAQALLIETWGPACKALETANTDLQAEVGRVTQQRDNLWMAYLHSRRCFHGGNGSTNPDQLARDAVDDAIAGRGPKDVTALKIAKKCGRLGAALNAGERDAQG